MCLCQTVQVSRTECSTADVTEVITIGVPHVLQIRTTAGWARVSSRLAMEASGPEKVGVGIAELAAEAASAEELTQCSPSLQCIVND